MAMAGVADRRSGIKLGFLKVDDDIAEDLVDVGELDDGVKGIPMTELVYRWC
jgi:hypothetical protein